MICHHVISIRAIIPRKTVKHANNILNLYIIIKLFNQIATINVSITLENSNQISFFKAITDLELSYFYGGFFNLHYTHIALFRFKNTALYARNATFLNLGSVIRMHIAKLWGCLHETRNEISTHHKKNSVHITFHCGWNEMNFISGVVQNKRSIK